MARFPWRRKSGKAAPKPPQETSQSPTLLSPPSHVNSDLNPSKTPSHSFPDGVKVLHDCPDATIDICFVHGLTGDRESTWTADGQSAPWPKTLLPLQLNNAHILTYGYDAYVVRMSVASANRLIDHATNLLAKLTTSRELNNASHRPLVFVAHSLGGLVCKEAILLSRNNPEPHLRGLFDCVKGIIFMGTPHKGAWMANWAKVPASALGVVKHINKSLLQILETDDQFLESIRVRFSAMLREQREGGRPLEVTCFLEELPLPVAGQVVSKESAILEGYHQITIHANHRNMVRFASAEESGFQMLLGELARWKSQVGKEKILTDPNLMYEGIYDRANLLRDRCHRQLQVPVPEATVEDLGLAADEERWLQSLYTTDYAFHRSTISIPVSGTCRWFLQHPKYTAWRDVDHSRLLWVSGDPGCGKSVLSSFLVDELTTNPPNGKLAETTESVPYVTLYFFCDDKIQEHRDASAIVRGILHQLVATRPVLVREHFKSRFQSRGTAAANELMTLWDLFVAVCQDKRCPPLIVVIDALDECEERSRDRFLSLIATFYANRSRSTKGNSVKMIITSRPEVSIADSLEALEEVRLKAEDETESISKDVVLVTQERLRAALRRFSTPAHVVQGLTERLTRQAGHTFLWVSLMLQMIERSAEASEDALDQLLVDLPDGLDGVYEKILARAQGRNRQKARTILQVVVAATRPLQLAELSFAISVRTGDTTVDGWQTRREPNLQRTLQLLCGPFLKVTNTSFVLLVHQTAKEFLLRAQGSAISSTSWMHTLDLAECHLTIARACLLTLPHSRSIRHQDEPPLVAYALEFWIMHLLDCEAKLDSDLVEQVIAFFTTTRTSPLDAAKAVTVLPYSLTKWSCIPHTRLGFASLCGFGRIIERLLSDGDAINETDGNGMTAIDYSALSGRSGAVNVLLQHGANPSQRTLELATNARSPDVVTAILRSSRFPPFSDGGRAQMLLAVETGHEELTKLLVERGVRTDMRLNETGDTPLIVAVKNGDARLARMVMLGSLHLQDSMGRTAVHWASEYGYEAVVNMLVASGAGVDDRCKAGVTPLLRAVKGRHLGVVRFLLGQQADANIPDSQGSTPLWWATINGDETLVRALLPVTRISDVQGPEHSLSWWARQNGHVRVAEILEAHQSKTWSLGTPSTQSGLPEGGVIYLLMCVAVRVNNCSARALVCTGAQSTIISESFARETKLLGLVDRRYSGVARGAGTASIVGRVHVAKFQLGPGAGVFAQTSFTVLEYKGGQGRDILLGLDFLRTHRCTVDFHQRKLVFPLMKTAVPMFEDEVERIRSGDVWIS